MSLQTAGHRSPLPGAPAAERQGLADEKIQALGVREQLDLLRTVVPGWGSDEETNAAPPRPSKWMTLTRRLVKTALALAVAIALGWTPVQRLFSTTSAEATVNARVMTLRAPIAGRIVHWREASPVGATLQYAETVLRIENPRADRSRLDELRRAVSELADHRDASAARLLELERQRTEQLAQFKTFVQYRTAHIGARRGEILAEKTIATARLETAMSALNRSTTLFKQGNQPQSAYEQAVREHSVLSATLAAIERRLEAAEVELAAAHEGVFVTDGFNDVPRSAQRASEMAQQIADLRVTIAEEDRRLTTLRSLLDEETRRYQTISAVEMTSPTDGRVWEILTSPGEEVHSGQELMRILDCNSAVITAAVSERTFNRLQIGGRATFRLQGEKQELPGHIIGLHGLASAPANLAINQGMLSREPYHATLEVPGLMLGGRCQIGRTGIVAFETAARSWLP